MLTPTSTHRRPQQEPQARSKRRSGPRERVCSPCRRSELSLDFVWAELTERLFLLLVKDKANHAVIFDKATSDRLAKDVQSYRLITVAVLVDRLKINGSLARQALADLEEKGQIKKVVKHSKLCIYSTSFSFASEQAGRARRRIPLTDMVDLARAVAAAE